MSTTVEFDAKGMPFRRLGPSGLRVPLFSLGGWLTLGGSVRGDPVREIIKTAFENGINMFDTAEGYAAGRSEEEMGRVIRELGLRRTDLVISTKLFWGPHEPQNNMGLSRKHIIEGTKESLQRLGLDYVDIIFAHRPDNTVPIEETVRAFNFVINQGWAFYWGTSEWSAREIEEAHHVADKLGLIAPVAEQCEHHMLHRDRPEGEYAPIYSKYGTGTTVFSALAGGLLTGKYNNGIPSDSRLAIQKEEWLQERAKSLGQPEGKAMLAKIRALADVAENDLGCKVSHLALAWIARNPNTSTVILGASKPEQIVDNLKALEVLPKLTPEIVEKVEGILGNKPAPLATWGRPPLDPFGRSSL
ncbi:NADP-dependent oxidoreductase domain-containing protein [Rhodofomes roseus]|uniref:NADP-dependent oxidoreductase domain-containing protein n=1 Tax=Rhodofomes roseus TaxID=34475 RepID=A0ABQ8K3Y4_9APHY|nr:NADP-dependent oxidoreductase domain-containing protein [Rhodofomes roseus]KAH9831617.1 NADP-dependent oxidoreductase domain-containing protein [Rhodofomes roseus]